MPATIFDPTMRGLTEALTLHQKRHEVLASNLANVETPGFRAQDLDFASALKEAFQEKPAEFEGLGDPTPRRVEDTSAPARADGNTVDLDLQMAKLGMNGGRYVSLARILALRVGLLRQAIEGNR
jgi:flagellar basal-body rod protein FlgB